MPTKSLISKFKGKDVDKIISTLERARNATQKAIDQFNNYRPEGKIKSLKSNPEFKKQSGINELVKQVNLLDKFISRLLDYKEYSSSSVPPNGTLITLRKARKQIEKDLMLEESKPTTAATKRNIKSLRKAI